jgi:signal transduction histidine kinase
MRRGALIALAAGLLLLLGSYIVYTQHVVNELRREAARTGQMFARVYRALTDPREEAATTALLDLSGHIRQMGVPVVVTDEAGNPTAAANLPFDAPLDDPRVRDFAARLDRQNAPVVERGVGTVHYGNPPLVRGLRIIPALQAALLGLLLIAGVYALRLRARAERERVWAGMARESAHQLATPLSSLRGWTELLEERAAIGAPASAPAEGSGGELAHMRGDLDRLERVAHRFERIGRPPRREPLDVGALATSVVAYFRARAPTLANRVTLESSVEGQLPPIEGDPVLLEWAVEALVKNAVDALAGRGGRVDVVVGPLPDGRVRLRVTDDGPGIPREMRRRVFEPGFSTKERGWGIGLTLARRIIEDNHGGTLSLAPSDRGATFDVILG